MGRSTRDSKERKQKGTALGERTENRREVWRPPPAWLHQVGKGREALIHKGNQGGEGGKVGCSLKKKGRVPVGGSVKWDVANKELGVGRELKKGFGEQRRWKEGRPKNPH